MDKKDLEINVPTDDTIIINNIENEPEKGEIKYRQPRKRGNKKKLLIILLSVLALLIIAVAVILIVKLTPEKPEYDNTGEFYFSSDLLTTDGGEFTVYDAIEFDVRNFADSLRVSDLAVEEYSVIVKAGDADITVECKISKKESALVAGRAVTSAVKIELPDDRMNSPVDVTVTSSPENIVLKGRFTVVPSWKYTYSDAAGDVCGKLFITADKETSLLLKWNGKLVTADPTNPYIKAGTEAGSCNLTIGAGNGAEIYFFKNDVTADYSEELARIIKIEKLEPEPSEQTEDSGFSDQSETADAEEGQTEIHENPEN